MAYVEKANKGKRFIPTIVFQNGSILVEPANAELSTKLGLNSITQRQQSDVIMVGGRPTSLTAAL